MHLAQAMHKSQKNYDGTQMFDNGAGAAKEASGTLRGCSPLTVSLLSNPASLLWPLRNCLYPHISSTPGSKDHFSGCQVRIKRISLLCCRSMQ